MDDDEAALAAAGAWEPDPVLADPTRSSRTRRMSDVIAALIGIYGSKELFITEYRCAGGLLTCCSQYYLRTNIHLGWASVACRQQHSLQTAKAHGRRGRAASSLPLKCCRR